MNVPLRRRWAFYIAMIGTVAVMAVIGLCATRYYTRAFPGVLVDADGVVSSLGLPSWASTVFVVLPQALRLSVPALVNTFIAFFKDTSLVIVIGLFDLLGAAKAVIVDARWTGFGVEVYLFAGAIYFTFCFAVSQYSRRLESNQQGI